MAPNNTFEAEEDRGRGLEVSDYDGPDRPTKQEEIESLRAQLAEVTRKYEESVGGFKRDIQEKLDQQRTKNKRLETKLLATQAHAARMENALEIIAGRRQCIDNLLSNVDIANAALSTPINLDALHEDRARMLEEAAQTFDDCQSGEHLLDLAAAHRAKKSG